MTHRMDGRGEFLTCAIPDQWMALEVCFCYRPDNDLSWVQPKTARKKSLQEKVHGSQIISTQLTSNPPHTTMSCQPPCCQQLKPEARSPCQHECIFLNSNYRSKRDFWQMLMEVQRIFPYFKNPFDCHWGVSSKFQVNVANLHAQGELSWEFVKF